MLGNAMKKGLVVLLTVVLLVEIILPSNNASAAEKLLSESDGEKVISKVIENTDPSEGIAFKNAYSGLAMNVKHGITREGAVIDTYKYVLDGTFTQRWLLEKKEKGYQVKSLVKQGMGLDVTTNGAGIPKADMHTALYTPTSDDCSYWSLKVKYYDDKTVAICFESKKTPGLYLGYDSADYKNKGKKRHNFILKTSITEDCWFKVLNPDGSGMKVEVVLDETDIGDGTIVYNSGVADRIKLLQEEWDGRYFTVNQLPCNHGRRDTCSNCRLSEIFKARGISTSGFADGNTCCAAQRYFYWEIYGEHDRSFTNQRTTNPVLGDIIEFRNSNNKVLHYAIYLDEDASNYYVMDSNYTGGIAQVSGRHGIPKTKYDHCVFYHANNYSEINATPIN